MLAKVKPCLPSENAATNGEIAISERKRRLQISLQATLDEKLSSSENVAPKRYNAYTERKRRSQRGNNVCPGGNFSQNRKRVHRTQTSHEKRVYRVKTSLARVKPHFLMAKMLLPSEIIASKVVSAFTERKLRSQGRKRVYDA